ncbi:DUF4326 domain-containing protein [Erythrobacter aureus]|uniref:DUF4326 domain-containing protein n=1 Tax=Erythrobacter aureus TaxID=2182384 RepID=A0A345YJ13_9SPHN|nr:DUF4326 domain-containing protein [Erythrobacter aureus]AXK43915.1 DUF4326 domain-containing protein [Erythrobacter aureus]
MGRVLNLRRDGQPAGSVYIGRGRRGQDAPFGNPHQIGKLSREQVVEAYERDLKQNDALVSRIRNEIADRDVVCFCAPAMCHGHVIVKVATMDDSALAAWKADPNDLVIASWSPADDRQASFGFRERPTRFSR